MSINRNRMVGGVACLLAIAVAIEARTFRVGFYTDPLGAAGVPYVVAVLVGAAGLVLFLRPSIPTEPPLAVARARVGIVTASLFAYAAILPLAGFFLSTTIVMAVIGVVFGGPKWRMVIPAAMYAVALYVLFSMVLGLSLPIGSLFTRG